MSDDVDIDAAWVRGVVSRLVACGGVHVNAKRRELGIITDWLEQSLTRKVYEMVQARPQAPVLSMYFSDGWSSKVATRERLEPGPHTKIDFRGRVTHEFALERAVVRQLRSNGKTALCLMARRPRGMCAGRRHGIFFRQLWISLRPCKSSVPGG